jgi:hypothetical protein
MFAALPSKPMSSMQGNGVVSVQEIAMGEYPDR